MTARPDFTRDQTQHLADELNRVFRRHLTIVEAGGGSPVEMAAIAMASAEAYAFVALGIPVFCASEEKRQTVFAEAIKQLAINLKRREPEFFVAVAVTDKLSEAIAR